MVLHRRPHPDAVAGRARSSAPHPVHLHRASSSATRSRAPTRSTSNHRFQANYIKIDRRADQQHLQPEPVDGPAQPRHPRAAAGSVTVNYTGVLTLEPVRRGRYSQRTFSFIGAGAKSTDLDRRHAADRQQPRRHALLVADTSAASARRRSATTRTSSSRHRTSCRRRGAGSHNLTFGYDNFNDIRMRQQPPVGQRLPHPQRRRDPPRHRRRRERSIPLFLGDGTTIIQWNPISDRQRGLELPHPLRVLQRHLARQRSPDREPRRALRQEPRRGSAGQRRRQGQRVQPAPRRRVGSERRRQLDR